MKRTMKSGISGGILLLGLVITNPSAAGNEAVPIPQLTVRGDALLKVPADQIELNIGVVTTDSTVDVALNDNNLRIKQVVQGLRKLGLAENEYHTGRFQIAPQWSPAPRNPPPGWRPDIVGYTVTNTLAIRTGKLELAGKIIAAANAAGANSVDAIQFMLKNPRASRNEAIAIATQNGIADANALAAAASVKLVRILDLKLDQATVEPVRLRAGRSVAVSQMAMDASGPPISADEVTVRANVLINYQVK